MLELATQTKYIFIIGNTQVGTFLVLLNVGSTDNYHYLYAVADFLKHTQLAVWLKAWQNAAGMVVVEKFTTQFEVKFSVKL